MSRPRAPTRAAGASPSFRFGRRGRAESDRQLVEPRQLVQTPEAEDLQELRGGAVEQRTTQSFTTAGDGDETALDQLVDHRARIDTANLIHFEAAHRLAIGDDRERLQGGGAEAAG